MPDLRHGAGAAGAEPGGRSQPRADRHEPALLGERRPDHSAAHPDHGRGRLRLAHLVRARFDLGAAGPGKPGRPVGRLALLRAFLGQPEDPQPQHVHPDRARRRRSIRLQPGGHPRAADLPRIAAHDGRRGAGLFRGGRRHHDSGPPRPGAGAARPFGDRQGDPGAARPRPQDGATNRRGRPRGGHPARPRPRRLPAADSPRREGAGGRRRRRGPQLGR